MTSFRIITSRSSRAELPRFRQALLGLGTPLLAGDRTPA